MIIDDMMQHKTTAISGNLRNTRIVVVKSEMNSGKTTTIWMVFFALRALGATMGNHSLYAKEPSAPFPSCITDPGCAYDFYAEVNWKGKHIALFSYGDDKTDVEYEIDGILSSVQPDVLICASRTKGDIWNLFETKYRNDMYPRIFIGAEWNSNSNMAILVKNATIEAIVKYI